MTVLFGWLAGQEWFRKVAVVLGLIAAVLFALAGFRRRAERTGRLIEREVHRAEVEKANRRVEEVKRTMEEVPRPSRPDVVDKLRGGKF